MAAVFVSLLRRLVWWCGMAGTCAVLPESIGALVLEDSSDMLAGAQLGGGTRTLVLLVLRLAGC